MSRDGWHSLLPRHAGLGFGLAALALLPAWDAVGSLPPHARSAAALAWMGGASLVLVCALEATLRLRGWARGLAAPIVLPVLAVMLWESAVFAWDASRLAVSAATGPHYPIARAVLLACAAGAAAACVAVAWRHGIARLASVLSAAVSLAAPLPVVVLVPWMWGGASPAPEAVGPAPARTVVLVFDGLDREMMETLDRPLPAFARLQSMSVSALNLFPPANYTSESLPGLLTGEDYGEATYTRRDILVRPVDGDRYVSIGTRRSLLTREPAATRLVGWHLPYCNVFRKLRSCWDDSAFRAPGREVPLPTWWLGNSSLVAAFSARRMAQYTDVREFARHFFDTPEHYRLQRIGGIFANQRRALLAALGDDRAALVFGHIACPHPPSLQRRGDGEDFFEAHRSNLVACDHLLGEVLDALPRQRANWRLVVTSDHWFRGHDWLQLGKPRQVPRGRRPVPFWVAGPGWTASTATQAGSSRVLPRVVDAAAGAGFDAAAARALLDSAGDGATRLRPF